MALIAHHYGAQRELLLLVQLHGRLCSAASRGRRTLIAAAALPADERAGWLAAGSPAFRLEVLEISRETRVEMGASHLRAALTSAQPGDCWP